MARRLDSNDRCGLCRRNLLTGERPRRFRDERQRAPVAVCALCAERAERLGWQPLPGDERTGDRPRLIADAAADADGTIGRLQAEIEHLRDELRGASSVVASARMQLEADARRVAAAEAAAAELRAALTSRDERLAELESGQEMLLRARRREADPHYLAGVAAEVFNRSGHLYDIQALAARLGDPVAAIAVDGIALPRPVRVVFAWNEGWRRFRVQCDLVARLFDVVDLGVGTMERAGRSFSPNARLVDGRLELLPERAPAGRSR